MGFGRAMRRLLCGSKDHASSKTIKNAAVEMNCEVWEHIPEELLDRILSWLPLPSFFRLRTVCKRWNNLVTCPQFRYLSTQGPPQGNWLLLCRPGNPIGCLAYDPTAKSWYQLCLRFLPDGLCVLKAAGGLLLCIMEDTIYVCNPLTKSLAELPDVTNARFLRTVGLAVDHKSRNGYKVVVVGCKAADFNSSQTEVYDSTSQSWRSATKLPKGMLLYPGKMTLSKGLLYCITSRPCCSIAVFDIQAEAWHQIDMPMYRFHACPWLLDCSSCIFLVGCAQSEDAEQSIMVWKLEEEPAGLVKWNQPAVMPTTLCTEFLEKSTPSQFSCVGLNDFVFICANHQVLVYSIVEDSWGCLPNCPLVKQDEAMIGFNFDPGLDAAALGARKSLLCTTCM